MECQTYDHAILEDQDISEIKGLAEDDGRDSCVHRISDVAIKTGHHEMFRWEYRRRGPLSLQSESREGVEKKWYAEYDEQYSENSNR